MTSDYRRVISGSQLAYILVLDSIKNIPVVGENEVETPVYLDTTSDIFFYSFIDKGFDRTENHHEHLVFRKGAHLTVK